MANTILLKRSDVANSIPATGNLVQGEMALNFADGNLFFKNTSDNIVLLASTKIANISGNITGGNINTTGQVVATGNVTGNFFLGNGSQLTGINTFSTISVAGQSNVVADSISDTLTFAAGAGIAILTDAGNDVITIATIGTGDSIFATGGTMGTVEEVVTSEEDLGLITQSVAEEYDLGTIVTGGLIYPSQLYIENIADFFILGGNPGQYLGTSGNGVMVWQTLDSAPLEGSMVGNILGNTFSIVDVASLSATGSISSQSVSLNFVTKTGTNGVGNIGQSDNTFNTVFARATSALYADLAECYQADADYEPGTVLVFGGNKEVTISTVFCDSRVAGVVSTDPAYKMNAGLTGQHVVTVALTGRVPCKVLGPVSKGDLMVSSPHGYAVACNSPTIGTVIGKSLENFSDAQGTIEIVVGVR